MNKLFAIKHFGGSLKLANALNITSGAVSQWRELIPEKQAMRLERLTNGQLAYNPDLYQTTQSALSEAVA